eukprot:PITA_15776
MLHHQSLPLHLWDEVCNTIVYLQNRSPQHILGMKTPMEAFSRKRPDVSHFRIFGSSVYCHVTKDARKKLDSTTELGILVGYTDTPHNYWVYLPTRQWIAIDAEQPHAEDPGVETSTHAESSRDGRKHSREANRLMMDARENAIHLSSQRRQRRSPERYTGYMALVGECAESKPSSFEEAVQKPVWVDAMEEYDSII